MAELLLVILGAACFGCGLWAGLRIQPAGLLRRIASLESWIADLANQVEQLQAALAQLQTQLQQPVQRHSPLPRPVVKGKQLTDDKEKSAKK